MNFSQSALKRRRTVQCRSRSSELDRASSTVVDERNMIVLKSLIPACAECLLILAEDQMLLRRQSLVATGTRAGCAAPGRRAPASLGL